MTDSEQQIVTRYKPPSRFDNEQYGKIYRVIGENETVDTWVQISKFEAAPYWINITPFFEKNFQDLLKTEPFQKIIESFF
jgi:hypothetical protein